MDWLRQPGDTVSNGTAFDVRVEASRVALNESSDCSGTQSVPKRGSGWSPTLNVQNIQGIRCMFDVQKKRHASRPETDQAPINASWEGWLAPAQCVLLSTLNGRDIERGQATLPNLHLFQLELCP